MKKLFLTLVLLVSMISLNAQTNNGGIFQRGKEADKEQLYYRGGPGLPGHGQSGDQPAPIGSGALMLIGFGAAYAIYKKNKK